MRSEPGFCSASRISTPNWSNSICRRSGRTGFYAPFFERYALNEYFWGYTIPEGLARVERWRQAVLRHAAVKATSLHQDHYIKLYADYALGFANGAIPPGHERSALDPAIRLDARPLPPRRV
jgi:glutathione S-transferase